MCRLVASTSWLARVKSRVYRLVALEVVRRLPADVMRKGGCGWVTDAQLKWEKSRLRFCCVEYRTSAAEDSPKP